MTRKKKSDAKRALEFLRCFGGDRRVSWVRSLRCSVCDKTPCENAHVRGGGTSRRAGACWIVPLCKTHHTEIHQHGANTFEIKYRVSLDVRAALTETLWREWLATHPPEEDADADAAGAPRNTPPSARC